MVYYLRPGSCGIKLEWPLLSTLPAEGWGRCAEKPQNATWFVCHTTICDFPCLHGFKHVIHRFTLPGLSHTGCWDTHTVFIIHGVCNWEHTEGKGKKFLCGQLGRAVVGSPDNCPPGALSCAAMVRMKRKMMGFWHAFPLLHAFFNGISSNCLLGVPLRRDYSYVEYDN